MTLTVNDSAIELESRIHQIILDAEFIENPFEIGKALLFGVTLKGRLDFELLAVEADVYDLLDSRVNQLAGSTFDAVAIVTTGWAAPLDRNGEISCAPSEHDAKRRVRLIVIADKTETMNVLRFEDDPEDVITDGGSAEGSLARAVQGFLGQ